MAVMAAETDTNFGRINALQTFVKKNVNNQRVYGGRHKRLTIIVVPFAPMIFTSCPSENGDFRSRSRHAQIHI
jgi:hypothetical protein